MSQIYKQLTSSGPIPPVIATSYVTDVNSPAIPAANVLNVPGGDTTANNDNGIRTDGSSGSNTLTVQLTNRLQGSTSTVGPVTGDVITFTPTVIGTYSIEFRVAAYNTTSTIGGGYSLFGAIRFDGANSVVCDVFDEIVNEEAGMAAVDLDVVASGANTILRVTGIAAQTINWSAVGLYTFIGV